MWRFFIGHGFYSPRPRARILRGAGATLRLAAPNVRGGFANTANANGLIHPGAMIIAEDIEPDVVEQQIRNKVLQSIYTGHGFQSVNRVAANENLSTGGVHALCLDQGNFMHGPRPADFEICVPNWALAATEEDATNTLLTPLTTNVFAYSMQGGGIQSNGKGQEQAAVIKAVPLSLIDQTVVIGTLRGYELSGTKDGDQHRPSRAIYYTK